MTFDKRITLLLTETANGDGEEITVKSRKIWANVRDIGVTLKYSAVSAGRDAELQVICHRSEYEDAYYNEAEYRGRRYRIDSTGAADTERHIKLILVKGG